MTMGKKGDLLRAQKAQKAVYTFTGEQLRKRDEAMRQVWKAENERENERYSKELNDHINKVWDIRRAEFNSGFADQDRDLLLSYLLSVSCRVLIENFGWKPIGPRRTKTRTFAEKVLEEINKIAERGVGVDGYADETDKLYGIQFVMTEDENE